MVSWGCIFPFQPRLWTFRTPAQVQLPKWECTWESLGSTPYTFPHLWQHVSHPNTLFWPHGPLHSTFSHEPSVRIVTRHVWCLQRVLSIFKGSRHHWTRWFHPGVWYLMWYVVLAKSTTIYTFPSMEGFIPTFGAHGWLSQVLWCPWGWHWRMAPILVAKLLFHHQRSIGYVNTYPINHYHMGWCGSFHSWGWWQWFDC